MRNRILKYSSGVGSLGAVAIAAMTALPMPQAQAANIITVANTGTSTSCGGAVLCSTNGTTGYLTTGGMAFDLSTILQWFQIDPDGVSHLAGQPAIPSTNSTSGSFLVYNDTGRTQTSLTLTLTDTFNSSSAGDSNNSTQCAPNGTPCQSFSAQTGNTSDFKFSQLSGSEFDTCQTGTQVGETCNNGSGSNAAAWFSENQVTYTWEEGTGGTGIPAGAYFEISYASWSEGFDAFPVVATPEPGSLAVLGSALAGLGIVTRRRRRG